ncbi:hypothetical protein Ferp_0534 [Ferroglobus placidus DSM 10642]|uniref:Uncharacterized protein n=1 Tax=Ferroglobus placidus (strain DSM 10642 / AEDII12DO) TaxID=589924 RepID=D3S375_FERPA|nr:hypothetical protein [Ferroglobus placidus]ADC64708.1 hypothetical protein Ferp_0534 [Ferroglobus placidus DSM 10642]
MLIYETDSMAVRQTGDILEIEIRRELDGGEFRQLCEAVDLASGLDFIKLRYGSSETGYILSVENRRTKSAGVILIPNSPVRMTVNLKTVEVESDPEIYGRFTMLIKKFGNYRLPLPDAIRVEDAGRIVFREYHGPLFDAKLYEAVLDVENGEIEYRIQGSGKAQPPLSPLYVVKDTTRKGKRYLVFKDALHPFDTVYYSILRDEIRYENDYGNRVAEFWRRVRDAGFKLLGADMQEKVLEKLKTESIDDVLEWYKKQHDKMHATLKRNEEVRELFERLITDCYLETSSCTVAVLPTDYRTMLLIHGSECEVLVKEYADDWTKRRDTYKVLRRIMDGRVEDAVREAESCAVKLDSMAAGERLVEEFKRIRKGRYTVYFIHDGRMMHGWDDRHKKLPDLLLPKLPMSIRQAVLAAML